MKHVVIGMVTAFLIVLAQVLFYAHDAIPAGPVCNHVQEIEEDGIGVYVCRPDPSAAPICMMAVGEAGQPVLACAR